MLRAALAAMPAKEPSSESVATDLDFRSRRALSQAS